MPEKRISWIIILAFNLLFFSLINPFWVRGEKINTQKVKRLKWIDPLGRKPASYKEFQAQRPPDAPLEVKSLGRVLARTHPFTKTNDSLVAVIVNSDLYPEIQTSLSQYVNDLVLDGYPVEVKLFSGGDFKDLRDSLRYMWTHSGLVGAVLVGDLPVAWYEFYSWEEEFPIDYYFMELDGTWWDADSNGLLEDLTSGSGDLGPEIWVGRLAPSSLTWGNEAQLLLNYFLKNHNYRSGNLSLPHRALSFVDDDWDYFYDCDLNYAYENVTVINDSNQTIAINYIQELTQNYEWVQLCAHSSCWAHTFLIDGSQWGGGSVYNYEIHALEPHALFYNLFACSNTKFMETNNLGNWYVFVDDYGLLSVGSTKSGSMLDFASFYTPLGQGKSIGDSFKEWFEVQAQEGFEDWERGWFFGMNILGDPTLTIDIQSQSVQQIDSVQIPEGCGSSSLIPVQVTTSEFSDGNPQVTVDFSGNVWTTWETGRDVRSNIYSSYYDGESWSSAEAVDVFVYWDLHPAMATDSSGAVWVAWQRLLYDGGFNICVSHHTSGGWASPTSISSGPDYEVEPKMTVDREGRVWVVWKGWKTVNQNVNSNIFARYYDGTWSDCHTITSDFNADSDPVIAADTSGRVWIVWSTNRDGNWDIYSVYYDGTWSELIPVTIDLGDDLAPAIVWDGSGKIWAAWQSWRDGDANIYASYNDGSGWSGSVQITSDSNNDILPDIKADLSGKLILTWMSNRCGNWDVFASTYDDLSWSLPEQVTTDSNNDYEPACGFDRNGNPFFVWASDRDTNWNVYFAFKYICGDANADGNINLSDVIYIANYYLRGGDPPSDPICRANANGDLSIDLSDVIYLANYYLKGGPEPHDCENYKILLWNSVIYPLKDF